MFKHPTKDQEKKHTFPLRTEHNEGPSSRQFKDNRAETVAQRKWQEVANNTPSQPPIQKQKNNTGLPDNLKSGIENLSGYSMDDVKVHRNSAKPAQLQAHAYAQGTDIHLAPGQDKHLPHEAWHVVQQKQGRVKPTLQMKGKVNINDDAGLEKEADVMGAKALQIQSKHSKSTNNNEYTANFIKNPIQRKKIDKENDGNENEILLENERQITDNQLNTAISQMIEMDNTNLSEIYNLENEKNKDNENTAQLAKIKGRVVTSVIWKDKMVKHSSQWLHTKGYSSRGILTSLRYWHGKTKTNFPTLRDALKAFTNFLSSRIETQNLKNKGGFRNAKGKRIMRHKRITLGGRPSFLPSTQLGKIGGDDTRHIIRNATIRDAIQRAIDNADPSSLEEREAWATLAIRLSGTGNKQDHIMISAKAIYIALYQCPKNLFNGPGAINRLIGLAADNMYDVGYSLLGISSRANKKFLNKIKVSCFQIISNAENIVNAGGNKLFGHFKTNYYKNYDTGLANLKEAINQRIDYFLSQAEPDKDIILQQEVGRWLMDIGDSLGIDMHNQSAPLEVGPLMNAAVLLINLQSLSELEKAAEAMN